MKHIGWLTLIILCLFAMKGLQRSSPDMHARNLVRISENKAEGVHFEGQAFDNNEMQHFSTLKKALDESTGRSEENGEFEDEQRDPAQER